MKRNINTAERIIRAIAGIGIMSLAFVGPKTPWAYLGIIPFLTGITGFCPPYALLGINTGKKRDKQRDS